MKKFSIIIILILLFSAFSTEQAFAHGNENSSAPDLHPLFVMLEFILIVWFSFKFSNWLAVIDVA